MTEDTIFPLIEVRRVGERRAPTVDGRELHAFLGVGRDFSTWMRQRIAEYGFIEGDDFFSILRRTHASDYSPDLGNNRRGQPRKEYILTIDMAKELAMVENNERGRQARRHFIRRDEELRRIEHGAPEPASGELTFEQKMQLVATAERLGGREAAIAVWHGLGLPPVAAPAAPALALALPPPKERRLSKVEAWACLRHMLDIEIGVDRLRTAFQRFHTNRMWDDHYGKEIGEHGIIYDPSTSATAGEWREYRPGVVVYPEMADFYRHFRFTIWEDRDRLRAALLRLPGAEPRDKPFAYGVFVPLSLVHDKRSDG